MEHAVQIGGTAALSAVETYASLLQLIQLGGLVCIVFTAKMVFTARIVFSDGETRTNEPNELDMAAACPSVFNFGVVTMWYAFVSTCFSLLFGLIACMSISK
jgi:hypothetical protein